MSTALRPLLVGTAWKVLDLLLEEALAQADVLHDRQTEYSISLKERLALAGEARPAQFPLSTWSALMSAYAATVEIRHSLIHRHAHTDATGALVGVDRAGQPLRPLTPAEHEAFVRAALIAADLALTSAADPRGESRLRSHLADLAALHGQQIAAAPVPVVVPEITIVIDPDPADPTRYLIDLPAVRTWLPFPSVGDCVDLIVAPRDRPGQELRGRLEDAPTVAVAIDPDTPPLWLHRTGRVWTTVSLAEPRAPAPAGAGCTTTVATRD